MNKKHNDILIFFCLSCSRVVEAAPSKVIVLPASGTELRVQLREEDIPWMDFLSNAETHPR